MTEKQSMNLAGEGVGRPGVRKLVPVLIGVFVAVAIVVKFGIVDRFLAVNQLRKAATEMQEQISEAYGQLSGSEDLLSDYGHYTYSGMTREELELASRTEVLELIQGVLLPASDVHIWRVQGNQLECTILVRSQDQLEELAQTLEDNESVDSCVIMASTSVPSDSGTVMANILINLHEIAEVKEP